jgi:hypothetical protein
MGAVVAPVVDNSSNQISWCRLMVKPLANPTGYAGPAGRRPPPLRILWAALRNVRLLFSISKADDSKPGGSGTAERAMEATRQLAVAAVEVQAPQAGKELFL